MPRPSRRRENVNLVGGHNFLAISVESTSERCVYKVESLGTSVVYLLNAVSLAVQSLLSVRRMPVSRKTMQLPTSDTHLQRSDSVAATSPLVTVQPYIPAYHERPPG